jgi:cation:H+ antiporter
MAPVLEVAVPVALAAAGVAAIVWGAERFAEHLASAAARLGTTTFALALLLAGAEPEELATAVAATLQGAPAIALGDVVGANVAIALVALGVGALVAPLPFGRRVARYALLGVPVGVAAVACAWDGRVGRLEGLLLVALYVGYVAAIWVAERRPPALGETGELEEASDGPPGSAVTSGAGTARCPPGRGGRATPRRAGRRRRVPRVRRAAPPPGRRRRSAGRGGPGS